jgi:hypothetical protein
MNIHRFVLLATLSISSAFAQPLISTITSIEGGQVRLINPQKTGATTNNWTIFNMTGPYNDGLAFWRYYADGTNAGTSVFFHDNGNVGIGTTNPANRLSVNGVIGVGADELRIQQSNFGYSSTYRVLRLGEYLAQRSLALNIDPLTVSGGQFSGHGQILIGRGTVLTPNASTSDWVGVLRALDNRVHLGGLMSSGELLAGSGLTVSNETGNVGVGTANPGAKLVVSDGGAIGFEFAPNNSTNSALMEAYDRSSSTYKNLRVLSANTFLNDLGGNVGIGTTNPQHKLSVNGTIKAKEVIVETTGWSDYVFADNYRLTPLSEVAAHIAEKKHLPGMPSAAEVVENGVNVAQVQAALLAKVEELTLHLIAQEKSLRELKAENETLKTRMGTYECR